MLKFTISILLIIGISCTQEREPQEIFQFIDPDHRLLRDVFDQSDHYEVQIRYTQIDRDMDGRPSFKTYDYHYDSTFYFYPASTVKMPTSFLALEKLNEINAANAEVKLTRATTMFIEQSRDVQTEAYTDSTTYNLLPSIASYIDKVFVVSDNDAYNRLYEFCGQDYINEKLRAKGVFTNSRIVHRVGAPGYSTMENRHTNGIKFIDEEGSVLYYQPLQEARGNYFYPLKSTQKGKGYYVDSTDQTVMEPFDMSKKNFFNLRDLEATLMRVIFPESFESKERYMLTEDQYKFLYKSMLKLPKDYSYLMDDENEEYYDGYVKFFLFGDTKTDIPEDIHIMNKVGNAYGYLTDCAYIFDASSGLEFFLTATIHVNENRIYNDGNYEYEEVGIPFLAELGRQIFDYEKSRTRPNKANFRKYLDK